MVLLGLFSIHTLAWQGPQNMVDPGLIKTAVQTGDSLVIPLMGRNVLAWEISYNGDTVVLDNNTSFYELTGMEEGAGPVVVTALGIDADAQLVRVPVHLQTKGSLLPACGTSRQSPDTRDIPVLPGTEITLRLGAYGADTATIDDQPMDFTISSGMKNFFADYVAVEDTTVTAVLENASGQTECFWEIDVVNGPPLQILQIYSDPVFSFQDRLDFEADLDLILETNEYALTAEINGTPLMVDSVDAQGNKSWRLTVNPGSNTRYTAKITNSIGEFQYGDIFVYVKSGPTVSWFNTAPNLAQFPHGSMIQLRVATNGTSAEIDGGDPMTPFEGAWTGFTADYVVTEDETVEAVVRNEAGGGFRATWEIDCGVAVFAGVDRVLCGAYPLNGNDLGKHGSGIWTVVSGDDQGSFIDPTDPNTSFTGTSGTTYELAWSLVDDPCESRDTVRVTFVDPGADLDLDGQPGLDNNDYLTFTSLWGIMPLSGGYLDEENLGVVSVLSLIRARDCIPR
ncbi:MAG: hypothetical protein QNK37_17265 [Acidobacteriota bacterium]|nr:hypothetical protein [Acidobacteriota bacterium]